LVENAIGGLKLKSTIKHYQKSDVKDVKELRCP
jgi:hypothetical protein